MQRAKKIAAVLICLCIILPLGACGGESTGVTYGSTVYGRYRTLASFGEEQFAIGFRSDDFVRYYVDAALRVLAADGTIHAIALKWFAEDTTTFASDAKAMDDIGNISVRTLIVGVDADAFPMSYADGSTYAGFDVDVAKALCDKLGWTAQFIPIKAENAYVELSSGNVDVAWGGLALDTTNKQFVSLAPYMTNELVLVVPADGGAKSTGKLKGKTLVMDVAQKYMDALNLDTSLRDRFGKITRLTGGAQKCFEALDSGEADAAIVYSVAARYYGK